MRVFSWRFLTGALLGGSTLLAMVPPDREMIEQYRKDGTLQERQEFARSLGNQKVNSDLVLRAHYKLKKMAMNKGLLPEATLFEPPPAWKDMPTTGNVKVFTILIDFNDYPHNETLNSRPQVDGRIFGAGDTEVSAPYESYRQFYQRSSYNKLNLGGNVMGWYRAGYNRAAMAQTTAGREQLIKEALTYFHNAGNDFSQYDNNHDGKVDFFAVVWTGPDTGWSNFWWGYQTSFSDPNFKLDGIGFGKYSWQWESRYKGADGNMHYDGAFSPKTLIHEQGHGLGLPDYYDYDDTVGPRGGVGGLDIMDWAGDHNCFSKWLLDWITPTVVNTDLGAATETLRDQSTNEDAIIVMPKASANTPFGEFYMVQNRQLTGNDASRPIPGDGLVVWHVDSRLDSNNFNYLYDNSYSEHKLLRLMEADGLEQIETTAADADAGDFYISGREIGPVTLPNTSRYDGTASYFGIRNISASGPAMNFDVYTTPADTTAPTGKPTKPTAAVIADTATFTWTIGTSADPDGGIVGYYLQVGSTPGASDVFDGRVGNVLTRTVKDLGLWDGKSVYGRVRAMNAAGLYSDWSEVSDGAGISLPTFAGCADLDNCNLVFKTVGIWEQDNTYFHTGATSVHGLVKDNEQTTIQTVVAGPGKLSFWWKSSSEKDYDFYSVMIDGIAQDRISGEIDWAQKLVDIPAGSHTISWRWAKDSGTTGALDKVWLDDVQYEKIHLLEFTTQPADQKVDAHSPVTFTAAVSGGKAPYTYQWYRDAAAIAGATSPSYTFTAKASDNGKKFKVVATDSVSASLSSREAVLTVNGGAGEYDEQEPNNTRATANLIPAPGVVFGRVDSRRDIDCFKVTLKAHQRLDVLMTAGEGIRNLAKNGLLASPEAIRRISQQGLRLDCLDSRGTVVATSDGEDSKSLSIKAKHNGDVFYVRVYYGLHYQIGDYQLELNF